MKYIITADWHLSNKPLRKRCYEKLKDFLNSNYNKNETTLVILGDLFDSTTSISWDLFYDIFNYLSLWKRVVIVLGNHDVSYRSKLPSPPIHILASLPNVTLTPKEFSVWGYYNDTATGNNKDILLMHKDVIEFNRFYDNDYAISIKDLNDYKLVISGHIHTVSKKGNCIIIGPPYPCTAGDKTKGALLELCGTKLKLVSPKILVYTDDIEKAISYASEYSYVVLLSESVDDISDIPSNVIVEFSDKKADRLVFEGTLSGEVSVDSVLEYALKNGIITEKQLKMIKVLYDKERQKISPVLYTED